MIPESVDNELKTHNIPAELLAWDHWVGWYRKQIGSKYTKVPSRLDGGGPASSDDPETWSAFASTNGKERIGYMFSEEDPFCGIDIDDCVDPETGEMSELARRLVDSFGSYTEISPSGTGIHIFIKGRVSGERRKHTGKGIEMYHTGRFFTVSGDHVEGTPTSIEEGQETLDKLYSWLFPEGERLKSSLKEITPSLDLSDEDILSKAFRARNGSEFLKLWNGDISRYPSRSEADLALVSYLSFWAGPDEGRIEKLFGESALNRDKWSERADYRRKTIDKALSGRTEFYGSNNGNAAQLITASGEDGKPDESGYVKPLVFGHQKEPGPMQWLVEKLIPMKYPTQIYGTGGVAKSYIALTLATAVAGDLKTWLEFPIINGPVLYLDFELEDEEQTRRAYRVARGLGLERPPENLHYLSVATMGMTSAFSTAAHWCKELGIVLLIVDSTGLALEGDSESSKDVIAFFRDVVGRFVCMGTCPLLIDHQSKLQAGESYAGKTAFGSGYKEFLSRSSIQVQKARGQDNKVDVRFYQKKTNFGPALDPFEAEIVFEPETVTVERVELDDGELASIETLSGEERVIHAVRYLERAIPDEVAELTGLKLGTVRNLFSKLKKRDELADTGDMREGAHVMEIPAQPELVIGADSSVNRMNQMNAVNEMNAVSENEGLFID